MVRKPLRQERSNQVGPARGLFTTGQGHSTILGILYDKAYDVNEVGC